MPKDKKQQVYCNFIVYIKDKYPMFRDYVARTCSRGFFKPPAGKGISGITIIIPSDEMMGKIEDHLYGIGADDLSAAASLVRSCILFSYLPDGGSFSAQKDDIPTSTLKKVHVEKVSGDTVTLAGGAVITPDKDYKTNDQGNGKKVAIWKMKSGIISVSNEDTSFSHATLSPKRGSFEGGRDVIGDINRASYIRTIFYAYHCVNEGSKVGQCPYRLPLLEYSASLIGHIADHHAEYLPDAMSVCNLGLSDIIFLIEPDCSIEPLIPDKILDEWWDNRKTYPIIDTYRRAFNTVRDSAACFGRRAEITRAFNAYRKNNPADVNTFEKLTSLYRTLAETNSLFGISNIFPSRVADRYKTYPALKMVEDDRRCSFENCLMDYESIQRGAANDLTNSVGLICDFHSKKNVLGFGAMLVFSSMKAVNKSFGNPVDGIIGPIYNSNLALYLPGMDLLPDHVAEGGALTDLNAFNIAIIEKIYPSQVREDIVCLDRMALRCYHIALGRDINIPHF